MKKVIFSQLLSVFLVCGYANSAELFDEPKLPLNCGVSGFKSQDGFFRPISDVTFEMKALTAKENSDELSIVFKTRSGEARPFTFKMQRVVLDPNGFESTKRVGGIYSYNNPFEPNSMFERNDKTGEMSLSGRGYRIEDAREWLALAWPNFKPGVPNRTTVRPYMMIGLVDPAAFFNPSTTAPREVLIAPSGSEIDSLLVRCFTN